MVLRERDEWLQSYTRQICKVPGRLPSRDPLSTMYVEKDTWLTDFDAIIRAYTAVFGGVTLIQYDTAHVLEDVLEAMDLDGSRAIHRYRLNVSSAGGQASPWRRIARKLKLGRLRRSILSLLSR